MIPDQIYLWIFTFYRDLLQALPDFSPGSTFAPLSAMGAALAVTGGYIDWGYGLDVMTFVLELLWLVFAWGLAYFILKAMHILG